MKKQQRYTPEFRDEAVKLVTEQGLSQKTAAERLAIPKGTLANWIADSKASKHPLAPGARSAAQLEAENAYKRAQASSQLTKAKKLNVEAEKDAATPPEAPANQPPDPRLADAELEAANMEVAASAEQMRRDEEKHQLEMQVAQDDHIANTVTNAAKVEADLTNKNKLTEHSMKMKEKDQKVRAMQAKSQPVAAKPKKEKSNVK